MPPSKEFDDAFSFEVPGMTKGARFSKASPWEFGSESSFCGGVWTGERENERIARRRQRPPSRRRHIRKMAFGSAPRPCYQRFRSDFCLPMVPFMFSTARAQQIANQRLKKALKRPASHAPLENLDTHDDGPPFPFSNSLKKLSLSTGALANARTDGATGATTIDDKIAARLARRDSSKKRRRAAEASSSSDESESDDSDNDKESDDDDEEEEGVAASSSSDEEEDSSSSSSSEEEEEDSSGDGESSSEDDDGDEAPEKKGAAAAAGPLTPPSAKLAAPASSSSSSSSEEELDSDAEDDDDVDDASDDDASDSEDEHAARTKRQAADGAKHSAAAAVGNNKKNVSAGASASFAPAPRGTAFSAASFAALQLSRPLLKACSALGYSRPTPIQVRFFFRSSLFFFARERRESFFSFARSGKKKNAPSLSFFPPFSLSSWRTMRHHSKDLKIIGFPFVK